MSDLNFDLAKGLTLALPGAQFFLVGNSWEGLDWRDERDLPSEAEIIAALEEDDKRLAARKIWETKAEFWAEFTEPEQLAIMDSTVAGIRLLERQLLLWNGEVWSDDSKVQAGLAGLVAVGILTNDRKQAILAT